MSFNRGIVDDFPIKCFGMSTQCANVSRPKQKQTCHLPSQNIFLRKTYSFSRFLKKVVHRFWVSYVNYALLSTIIKDDEKEMAGKLDTSI